MLNFINLFFVKKKGLQRIFDAAWRSVGTGQFHVGRAARHERVDRGPLRRWGRSGHDGSHQPIRTHLRSAPSVGWNAAHPHPRYARGKAIWLAGARHVTSVLHGTPQKCRGGGGDYQIFPYEKNPLVNVTRSRVVVFQEEMVDPIIYGKKRKQTNTMTYH